MSIGIRVLKLRPPDHCVCHRGLRPPPDMFRSGQDVADRVGIVPWQFTGGTARMGRISKMRQRDIRRLPIIGAMAVVRRSFERGHARGLGRLACWTGNRRCSLRLIWSTKWLEVAGPCSGMKKTSSGFQRRPDWPSRRAGRTKSAQSARHDEREIGIERGRSDLRILSPCH